MAATPQTWIDLDYLGDERQLRGEKFPYSVKSRLRRLAARVLAALRAAPRYRQTYGIRMLGRRRQLNRESRKDSAVADVEQILTRAALEAPSLEGPSSAREVVAHALLICACVSLDDAPTWLIYDTPDGRIAWLRVPDGTEPSIWLDAQLSAGGHADPAEVLRWLQQDAPDPWSGGGNGFGHAGVMKHLRAKISSPQE